MQNQQKETDHLNEGFDTKCKRTFSDLRVQVLKQMAIQ